MNKPRYAMPEGLELQELARLESRNSLRLCAPLTPTQNEWRKWHWSRRRRFRDVCLRLLSLQVREVLGGDFGVPWARLAEIHLIRCSLGTVEADTANVIGGVKELIDTLLAPKDARPGIGLVAEDSPAHLLPLVVEDRPRGRWNGVPGPGTWVWVHRLTPGDRQEHGWSQP